MAYYFQIMHSSSHTLISQKETNKQKGGKSDITGEKEKKTMLVSSTALHEWHSLNRTQGTLYLLNSNSTTGTTWLLLALHINAPCDLHSVLISAAVVFVCTCIPLPVFHSVIWTVWLALLFELYDLHCYLTIRLQLCINALCDMHCMTCTLLLALHDLTTLYQCTPLLALRDLTTLHQCTPLLALRDLTTLYQCTAWPNHSVSMHSATCTKVGD